jgi:hypothetical protein
MESFLNILWLVIALSAMFTWRMHWVRQEHSRQRNPVQEWTALLCGLVLLFFAVSLTDDLHSEIVLFDECAGGRRYSLVCSSVHGTPHGAKTPAVSGDAILPRTPPTEQFRLVALISPARQDVKSHVRYGISSGRAPPIEVL